MQNVSTLNSMYNWKSHQPCWMCFAFKKGGPADMRFTCVTDDERWSATAGTRIPWQVAPAILQAVGFRVTPASVPMDPLHVWFLGIGRDFAGSAIVAWCESMQRAAGSRVARLRDVSHQLREWQKETGVHMRLRKLTVSNISWKGSSFTGVACKGADLRSLIDFLRSRHEAFSFSPLLQTAIWAASEWANMQFRCSVFFTEAERERFASLTRLLVRSYISLSLQASRQGLTRFKLRPKLHLLQHALHLGALNAHVGSTWLDEDEIGKTMKLFRHLRSKTIEKRALERYWVGMHVRIQKYRGRFDVPAPKRRKRRVTDDTLTCTYDGVNT